jgi:cell division cycle 14
LYWISDTNPPKCKTSQAFYFCIDDNLVYEPFFEDFGPLNLAMTHKYVMEVDKIMSVIRIFIKYIMFHIFSEINLNKLQETFYQC